MGQIAMENICFGSTNAQDINYDNVNSNLQSVTVQHSIDELAIYLGGLKFKKVSSHPDITESNTIYFVV